MAVLIPKTTRVCYRCKTPGEMADMILDESVTKSGNTSKKWFHKKCHEEWSSMEGELEAQNALNETLMRIHGVPAVLAGLWQRIREVRDGTIRRGSRVIKKYREGVPFPVIEQAYLLAEKDIQYALQNKTGSFNRQDDEKLAELVYCFAIAKGKIPLAYHRMQKAERVRLKSQTEEREEIDTPAVDETPATFKKRDNKNDIRALLND